MVASIYEYCREELASLLAGEPRYRLDQLWQGLWVDGVALEGITTIPKSLRTRLRNQFPPSLEVANDVANITCSSTSPTLSWPLKPACPVAQNVHPIAQPACDETHTVTRSS